MKIYGIGENKTVGCGMGDSVSLETLAPKCIYTGGHYPLFTNIEVAEEYLKENNPYGRYHIIELELRGE